MPKPSPRKPKPSARKPATSKPKALAPEHERFAIEYAAAELEQPGSPGNGSRAYQKAFPDASLKTAQNQALTLSRRPEIRALIDSLLLSGKGSDHLIYTPAYLAHILFEAVQIAREERDAATLGRLVELADRNCFGGSRLIKQTKNTTVRVNKFEGKTPAEIEAMKDEARAILAAQPRHERKDSDDPDHASRTGEVGAGGSGGEPFH